MCVLLCLFLPLTLLISLSLHLSTSLSLYAEATWKLHGDKLSHKCLFQIEDLDRLHTSVSLSLSASLCLSLPLSISHRLTLKIFTARLGLPVRNSQIYKKITFINLPASYFDNLISFISLPLSHSTHSTQKQHGSFTETN